MDERRGSDEAEGHEDKKTHEETQKERTLECNEVKLYPYEYLKRFNILESFNVTCSMAMAKDLKLCSW